MSLFLSILRAFSRQICLWFFSFFLFTSFVDIPIDIKSSSSIFAKAKKKKKKKKSKKKKRKKKKKKSKKKKKKAKLSKEVREAMRKAKEAKAKKASSKGIKGAATTGATGSLDQKAIGIGGKNEKREKITDLEKRFDDQFEKNLGVKPNSTGAGKTGIDEVGVDKSSKLISLLSSNRNIVTGIWVGGSKSFFDTSGQLSSAQFCRNVATSAESCSAGSTSFSAGADGWYKVLPWLKVGGGVSYMNFGSAQAKFKGNIRNVGIVNLDQSFSLSYFTIMPSVRYDLSAFYAAVGFAPSFMNFNVSSYSSNGTVSSDSFAKSNGWAFMTLFGLLIPINNHFSFDIFARLHYFTGQVSRSAFDPINSAATSTESTSGAFVLTPGFALSFYL